MLKDADGRRRTPEFRVVAADGVTRGPDLPDGDWPAQTVALYESIRRDAIAKTLTEPDWWHIVDTMNLHRILWSGEPSNALKVAAEVRLRLQSLGVTPEGRARLRLMVEDQNKPESKLDRMRRLQAERNQPPRTSRAKTSKESK